MKYTFQLISDLHLEFGTYHRITAKATYLVLAGDIGYPETQIFRDFMKQCSKKFEKVFYTSGNHEYYQCNKNKKSIAEIDAVITDLCKQFDNVYYLQNSCYEFDDLKIVGSTLWSDVLDDYETNDYKYIHNADKSMITSLYNKNKNYISDIIETSDKPLLVMTHHLPSYKMILPVYEKSVYQSHYASELDHLFRGPVVTWVAGHSHGFHKQLINGIPCIINGIGYPSEPRRGASLNFVFDV